MHPLVKCAIKDANTFELGGFNRAWQRLQAHPELHCVFWAWLKDARAALLMKGDKQIKHILTTLKNARKTRVDLHGLYKDAAIATVWHFVATAKVDSVLLFVTGKGTHSAHYTSVLLQHLKASLKAAGCKFEIPAQRFCVRITCAADTQRRIDTYVRQAAAQRIPQTGKCMKPTKQHRKGDVRYSRQESIVRSRKKKHDRAAHRVLRDIAVRSVKWAGW